jgi:YesN/AraC family two-component response regulator
LYRWIEFSGHDLQTVLSRAGIYRHTNVIKHTFDHLIDNDLEKMRSLLALNTVHDSMKANAGLLELLAYLVENLTKTVKVKKQKVESVHEGVVQAIKFMKNHYMEGIQVNQVVRYVGFERSYFSKIFSCESGCSIREYLANMREQKAKKLLESTRLSVASIAQSIGFSESKTFSRFFVIRTGDSPKTWRAGQYK